VKRSTAARVISALVVVSSALFLQAAAADPTGQITKVATGGVTPGFAADSVPESIVAGPDGNLWFTQGANPGRISRITTDGTVTTMATGGVTPGFSANTVPALIAVGPDGNLWFTEIGGNAIARITPDGVVTEFSAGLPASSEPFGIAAGPDGNLWFTTFANPGRVGTITPAGTITMVATGGITPNFVADAETVDITAGPDGNLWFLQRANPGRIVKITPAGDVTVVATGGSTPGFSANGSPNGIVTGPDGNLWVTLNDGAALARVTTSGGVTEFPLPGGTENPLGITVGCDGNLWFAAEAAALGRSTPDGVITLFTDGLWADAVPRYIALGADGNVWFTDDENAGAIGKIGLGCEAPPPPLSPPPSAAPVAAQIRFTG
jgi:streptogramin lyase